MAETLEITAPDDWHLHLRDGDLLRRVLPATAARFRRAIVMPNLDPPVRTVADARACEDADVRGRGLGCSQCSHVALPSCHLVPMA